jgi:hypothetical protein
MNYDTLMEAQMGEWPDSVVLTDIHVYELVRNGIPDWLVGHKFEDWRHYDARHEMGWYASIGYENWKQLEIEMTRARWARSAFKYRGDTPQGFFYVCGKREDGTYQHVGFRYGTRDSEYASGFDGLQYTPQGESNE